MMNIHQCQKKAQEIGCHGAQFMGMFPAGPKVCRWIDAHFGFLTVDAEGLREGFFTVDQIDEAFPGLVCSEPYIATEESEA